MAIFQDEIHHENRDPLSDEKGAHPVGVGVGAAVGAGVLGGTLGSAGAAISIGLGAGAAAGPVGAVVGALAGGVIGGLAGKTIAEKTNPTERDSMWAIDLPEKVDLTGLPDRGNMVPDDYDLAYQYGWDAHLTHPDRKYDEFEPELKRAWTKESTRSQIPWEKAKPAVRLAWDQADPSEQMPK